MLLLLVMVMLVGVLGLVRLAGMHNFRIRYVHKLMSFINMDYMNLFMTDNMA